MLSFIIRLDDATPKMNKAGWDRLEFILDKYNIKPIVGIIPESHDILFTWEEDPYFWSETVSRWVKKGWVIAQHGCHHVYHECVNKPHSEFSDLSYQEQMALIQKGHDIMVAHGVNPECFFAPAHNFDDTTVAVCRDSGFFKYISDGYALYPYTENNMLFLPNLFDTPHKTLPFGIYTFVFHPSFTTDAEIEHLEKFLEQYQKHFIPVSQILEKSRYTRSKNIIERLIHPTISGVRKVRKLMKGRYHGE